MKQAHLITVLGREIPVRSSSSAEKVRTIEAFVNDQIDQIRSRLTTADPQLLITLAMLNVTEAYLDLQASQPSGGMPTEERITQLMDRLDKALETPGLLRET